MASSSQQKVCDLCDKTVEPDQGRELECHHWACAGCVQHFTKDDKSIRCPLCKTISTIATPSDDGEGNEGEPSANLPGTGDDMEGKQSANLSSTGECYWALWHIFVWCMI